MLEPGQVDATLVADGLTIRIGGNAGGTAFAFYPTAVLAALSRPTGFVPEYGATLIPFWLETIYRDPSLFQSDRIHPTADGIERLVAATLDKVEGALPAPAPAATPAR